MTGFELNMALAELTHPNLEWVMSSTCYDNTTVAANSGDGWTLNYCNNWNDLMPLVEEYIIVPDKTLNGWSASKAGSGCYVPYAENLQLALAECLLKVLSQCNK